MTTEQFSKAGFLKSYVFPALFVLLIPGIGIWFAGYATRSLDGDVQENALASIRQDTSVSPEDKETFSAFYQETPASAICRGGTPQLNDLATALEDVCSADRQFGWIRQISWACIGIGLFAFLFASACVGVSLLSQRSLFASFLAGWHVLRIAALLQAVGQGVVARDAVVLDDSRLVRPIRSEADRRGGHRRDCRPVADRQSHLCARRHHHVARRRSPEPDEGDNVLDAYPRDVRQALHRATAPYRHRRRRQFLRHREPGDGQRRARSKDASSTSASRS